MEGERTVSPFIFGAFVRLLQYDSLSIFLHYLECLFHNVLIAQLSRDQVHKKATTDLLRMCCMSSSCLPHIAYFLVHSLAHSLYLCGSVLYSLAISGTNGSSGLGSHRREQIDRSTFDTVSAGDHWDRRMSRHMAPLLLMFGW